MAQYYEGVALAATGGALAARRGGEVTVILASGDNGPEAFRVALAGAGVSGLVSAAVLYTRGTGEDPADWAGQVAALPVAVAIQGGARYAVFTLDPGGPSRGAAFEIARITLR